MAASTCYTNAAALTVVLLCCSLMTAKPAAAATELPPQPAMPTTPAHIPSSCPPYTDTSKYRRGNFTDHLNTTVSISPKRPTANVPVGDWISGRATFYGADQAFENRRVSCGEPPGQFGVIEQGSCGYTNSDGTLPFPRDTYAAVADTNEDYPGSCGRCYQIRCKTGLAYNNGRPLQVSDFIYGRIYNEPDSSGRPWPGSPYPPSADISYTKCWDDNAAITVRVGDSCPCKYNIKETGEIRTQYWCCGGNNHFDLSFWAFEKLAHPSYGLMAIEYRPVDCETNKPLKSIPGYVSQTIYDDSINAGWGVNPYSTKDTTLLARGQGVGGSTALCTTISQDGAVAFICRECTRPGYQPFAKAQTLKLSIRSNTESLDPFASSTPPGALPALKIFLMNDKAKTYCGAEVVVSPRYARNATGDWYDVSIPLTAWRCSAGSTGSLADVDRMDLQNTNIRDAEVCIDNIQLA